MEAVYFLSLFSFHAQFFSTSYLCILLYKMHLHKASLVARLARQIRSSCLDIFDQLAINFVSLQKRKVAKTGYTRRSHKECKKTCIINDYNNVTNMSTGKSAGL